MQARVHSRSNFYHYSSVYSREELREYFTGLHKMLSENRQRFTKHIKFKLTNTHGALKLAYSPTDNVWKVKENGRYHVLLQEDVGRVLASRVSQHFGITNNLSAAKANLVLGTIINASNDDEVSLSNAMLSWMRAPAWAALHMPNKDKANIRDIHKNTWLKLAVEMGEPELVKELHKLMWFFKKDRKQLVLSSSILAAAVGGLIASSVLINPVGIAVCAALIFFELLDWKHAVNKNDRKRVEAAILKHITFENAHAVSADLSSMAAVVSHLSEEDRVVAMNALRAYADTAVEPEAAIAVVQEPVPMQHELEQILSGDYTPSPKY